MRIKVNDLTMYYVDVGPRSKPTIVMIHGFPLSSEMWKDQILLLKEKYRVIAFDLRGQGRSGAGNGQFTLEFLVDDLIRLMDSLRIERATLCGLSMGGYVALRAVERDTDRVSALVLCDTKSEPDTNEGKLARSGTMKAIRNYGVNAFASDFVKNAFSPSSFSNARLVNAVTRIIRKNKPLGLCGTLLALASRTDTTPFLPNIRVPTLIMVGDHDKITPPEVSERMHSSIRNSKLCMIANAGHFSNLENPSEFNACLMGFLDENPAS